jgi:hypothetical protein
MKTQTPVRVLSILLLLAPAAMPGLAASFSAELVDTRAGQTRTCPFNYQDKSYRFEVVENGQTLVITFDGQSGVMRLLVPSEKTYLEAGPDDVLSRLINPFGTYAYYARTRDVKAEGTESIAGFACTKQVVSGGGQVFVTAWGSEEFGFPLKVETTIDGRTVELRNIKRGPQDPALFTVPADYKLTVPDMSEPPPEWAGQVPSAPVLKPPFEQTLAEGKIIRIRPQAGRQISLQGTHAGGESCAFTAVGFKAGRPLSDPSFSTVNLEPEQSVKVTFSEGPAEADEIVIHVRAGTVKIKAEFVAAPKR